MPFNRDDYRAVKQMDKKKMEEYLSRVFQNGYEAGKQAASAAMKKDQAAETEIAPEA